jgi:inosose dehydratase
LAVTRQQEGEVAMQYSRRDFTKLAAAIPLAIGTNISAADSSAGPNIKGWSYMDHWSIDTPIGYMNPKTTPEGMDRFVKEIAAIGFRGYDTFAFTFRSLSQMFGSSKNLLEFFQERGIEKIVGLFGGGAAHDPSTHDQIFREWEATANACNGLGVENFVICPGDRYWKVAPVTDEKLKNTAIIWNRVGKMAAEHGIRLGLHHEFENLGRRPDELEKLYRWTDPKYVWWFCDTAQHAIAGIDPVALYEKYHDRCSGFHFKDTHNTDSKNEYLEPPDCEIEASVTQWFWEMGTPGGLINFPALMAALKKHNYRGWLCAENDKVDIGSIGGTYAEATCVTKWYIDNLLSRIYS